MLCVQGGADASEMYRILYHYLASDGSKQTKFAVKYDAEHVLTGSEEFDSRTVRSSRASHNIHAFLLLPQNASRIPRLPPFLCVGSSTWVCCLVLSQEGFQTWWLLDKTALAGDPLGIDGKSYILRPLVGLLGHSHDGSTVQLRQCAEVDCSLDDAQSARLSSQACAKRNELRRSCLLCRLPSKTQLAVAQFIGHSKAW